MALNNQRDSTSSAAPSYWEYDVFISFRGEDTRRTFTDHLYDKLVGEKIKTFRDDHELERGTTISLKLSSAIEQSWYALIVLSPNYASSTWCLDELAKIVECMEDRNTILPIFYDVDPSHVRKQTGIFAEALDKHEKTFVQDIEKVQGWRSALTKVGGMLGWTSKDRYETKLIKEIVETVCNKVHPTSTLLGSTEKLVGIDFRLRQIDLLLDLEANDVRFIGIWGAAGTGKTTLARLVYEGISRNFQVSRFVGNVKEVSAALQKVTQVWDACSVSTMAKNSFCNKKVLLVIDDVGDLNQLETLAGKKDWYGLGSRIIITTRNEHLLVEYPIDNPYELLGIHDINKSSQLYSREVHEKDQPEEDYLTLPKNLLGDESLSEDDESANVQSNNDKQPADKLQLAEGESSSEVQRQCQHPRCAVCNIFISENLEIWLSKLYLYKLKYICPIWQEKYCRSHSWDGTDCCRGCDRFEPIGTKFSDVANYSLCPQCQKSAIRSIDECQSLCNEVGKFFHDFDMKLQIPVDLVDRRTLVIWLGLPRLITGSSLAKVMMQAWLRINNYSIRSHEVQQGICLAFSNMWLDSQTHSSGSRSDAASSSSLDHSKHLSDFDKKLVEYKKWRDDFLEYGDASVIATKAVRKHGLGKTLQHIERTGRFPPEE